MALPRVLGQACSRWPGQSPARAQSRPARAAARGAGEPGAQAIEMAKTSNYHNPKVTLSLLPARAAARGAGEPGARALDMGGTCPLP